MSSYSFGRLYSLLENGHLPNTQIISNWIYNDLSSASASENDMATMIANTTANQSSYIQDPYERTSSNVPDNALNAPFPITASRPSPTHHRYGLDNSASTSVSKNTIIPRYDDQSPSNQSPFHPSHPNPTHPTQLIPTPYHTPPQTLYTQRAIPLPPGLSIPRAQNPSPTPSAHPCHASPQIIYSARGRYPPPGINTQRGQYPVRVHEAWYYRDSQHGCPGCVHEILWPRDLSRYHWPACPVSATREMAVWM